MEDLGLSMKANGSFKGKEISIIPFDKICIQVQSYVDEKDFYVFHILNHKSLSKVMNFMLFFIVLL